MNKSAQARKFARSLIESLDKDADLDSVYSELTDMSEMLKGNAELLNFFMNPGIPGERKEKALEEIIEKAGASVITKSFLLILFRKRGIFLLPLITEQFLLFADLQCNRVRAEITVADSLDESESKLIRERLSEVTGKEVVVNVNEDPSIIGGVVTKIGSLVVDGSIRTQFEIARNKLIN